MKGTTMPNTPILSRSTEAAKVATLSEQVVETTTAGTRWVIASFELREDAEAFAAMKRELRSGAAYEVRESPEWTQMRADVADFRTLRRGVEVAAELAERDL